MRLLVTGAAGQVGTELVALAGASSEHEVVAAGREVLDLTDREAIRPYVEGVAPDAVVNCAAYNAVDRAEDEPDLAHAVNGVAPGELAAACANVDAFFVHISTDYVFDGDKGAPYDEDDTPNPRSEYGRSKLAGEEAVAASGADHATVRTAWVFGRIGRSLVELIVRNLLARQPLRMVDDQTGTPTHAGDLAGLLLAMATRRTGDLFHATNAGTTTPYQLAAHIAGLLDVDAPDLTAITTEQLGRPAPRPTYSALVSTRLADAGLTALRHHHDAVADILPALSVTDT